MKEGYEVLPPLLGLALAAVGVHRALRTRIRVVRDAGIGGLFAAATSWYWALFFTQAVAQALASLAGLPHGV